MEANTGNKETARMEGNMPMELSTSSQGEHRFGQQGTSGIGDTLPTLNPMATSFTPRGQTAAIAGSPSPASETPTVRPAIPRPSTPPTLEDIARELRELKASGKSNEERLAIMHDQRRQLLRHMTDAKAKIDELEQRLRCEMSVEGSQDVLNRLKELNGLREWVGNKWIGLGEEIGDLEAEVAVPGG